MFPLPSNVQPISQNQLLKDVEDWYQERYSIVFVRAFVLFVMGVALLGTTLGAPGSEAWPGWAGALAIAFSGGPFAVGMAYTILPYSHHRQIQAAVRNHQWDNRWLLMSNLWQDPAGLALLTAAELQELGVRMKIAPAPVQQAWSRLQAAQQGVRRCHRRALVRWTHHLEADQDYSRTDPNVQRQRRLVSPPQG